MDQNSDIGLSELVTAGVLGEQWRLVACFFCVCGNFEMFSVQSRSTPDTRN